jgi:HAD superfamily hydrolase (TIGR01509 family)
MQTYEKILEGIAAVLFDLDGTLVDSNEAHARAWADAFAEHGHTLDLFIIKSLIGMSSDKLITQAVGRQSEAEVEALTRRRSEIFHEKYLQDVYPIDKANELIVLLKNRGLRVLLATAADKKDREALLRRGRLQGQFQGGADASDVEESKPAPDTLLACLEGHELEPSQCLVIGDTPYDGRAAHDAGMRFLGVETGGYNRDTLSNAAKVVPSVTAIYHALTASVSS